MTAVDGCCKPPLEGLETSRPFQVLHAPCSTTWTCSRLPGRAYCREGPSQKAAAGRLEWAAGGAARRAFPCELVMLASVRGLRTLPIGRQGALRAACQAAASLHALADH
eukprot:350556-Chlamydomonas_euryale.AAC.16